MIFYFNINNLFLLNFSFIRFMKGNLFCLQKFIFFISFLKFFLYFTLTIKRRIKIGFLGWLILHRFHLDHSIRIIRISFCHWYFFTFFFLNRFVIIIFTFNWNLRIFFNRLNFLWRHTFSFLNQNSIFLKFFSHSLQFSI